MESIQYVEKIRKFNRYYANVLGKIDQEIYNPSFPLTEARVISEIHYSPGCTATEIREKLGVDRGYMSRILQRFEEEQLILKKQSLDDKRQYALFLTEKGNGVFEELVDRANRGVDKMIQNIPETDLTKLVSSMETIESIYTKEQPSHVTVAVRPFQPGDVGYVAYLHGRYYSQNYQFGKIFEYYVMKGLTEFLYDSEGGQLWIAEVNGQIAGSIAITKAEDTVAQLRWFILDEPFQDIGLGKKLMETALRFCVEQNYKHVYLWTVSSLAAARSLYTKYQFVRTEEKPNDEWSRTQMIEERWDLDLTTTP
ncbi:MarR family transcriptional regulator [Brevibacillus nitrificans]|uniref:MarR family transcriptional regulator n=1 Tax=Brevibacillus nitrificans TaxID=651560 RepID=A0A3M8DLD3_9BACL|nr:helix-turn-helix domain-containing GNAT family N-acetyltransferase [Brevibacillus nitrificans]RNB87907.1 MarR family transcriptional regulator [Brevibacillus nitrificans]